MSVDTKKKFERFNKKSLKCVSLDLGKVTADFYLNDIDRTIQREGLFGIYLFNLSIGSCVQCTLV